MKRLFKNMKKIVVVRAAMILVFTLTLVGSNNFLKGQDGTWVAPESASKTENPYTGDADATKAGKKLYDANCSICHGPKGKGDGMAGMALTPRPSNFTKEIVQNQTDGEIFWKITEGKTPMAAYETVFSEEQRWQLVNYVRSFKK
jgi:mono/diheme cytochrome c family protein